MSDRPTDDNDDDGSGDDDDDDVVNGIAREIPIDVQNK